MKKWGVKPGAVFRKDGPWDWWRVVRTMLPTDKHYDGGLPGVSVQLSSPTRLRKDGTVGQTWSSPVFIPARSKAAFVRWGKDENRRPA